MIAVLLHLLGALAQMCVFSGKQGDESMGAVQRHLAEAQSAASRVAAAKHVQHSGLIALVLYVTALYAVTVNDTSGADRALEHATNSLSGKTKGAHLHSRQALRLSLCRLLCVVGAHLAPDLA